MINIENPKLLALLMEKNDLVTSGRKISSQMETIEFKIKKFQDKEKIITAKIDPKELREKAEALQDAIQKQMKEFDVLAREIQDIKLAGVPAQMKADHLALMKEREQMERDRNKIALKVQKLKDKAVPIIKKEVKPHLQEYDDIETAEIKDGKIVVKTFNHLEQFRANFKKKHA